MKLVVAQVHMGQKSHFACVRYVVIIEKGNGMEICKKKSGNKFKGSSKPIEGKFGIEFLEISRKVRCSSSFNQEGISFMPVLLKFNPKFVLILSTRFFDFDFDFVGIEI